MILNKQTQQLINKVATELGINQNVATMAYRSYWMFIKQTISELPDLNSITKEEFDSLKVNFNILELGKFTSNYNNVCNINKCKNIVTKRLKEKNEANKAKKY